MILARPIPLPSDPRRFLLQRDREIPIEIVPRLQQFGIRDVWVRHRRLEFLEAIFNRELDERQRELYGSVRRNFEAILGGPRSKSTFNSSKRRSPVCSRP